MSQFIWMITLTVSLCAIVLSAAIGDPTTLMCMTAVVSLFVAVIALRTHKQLETDGASRATLSASTARHMGLIWLWGALGLLVSYGLILNGTWDNWPTFFSAFAAAAIACLTYAATVDRDELLGREDDSMVNLGRYLTIVQLLGMLATMIGLWLDPSRKLLSVSDPAWVANNIFAAGAMALTAISGYALLRDTAFAEAQAGEAR